MSKAKLLFIILITGILLERIVFAYTSLGIDMESLGHLGRMFRYFNPELSQLLYQQEEPYSFYNFYGLFNIIWSKIIGLNLKIPEFFAEVRPFYIFMYVILVMFTSVYIYLSAQVISITSSRTYNFKILFVSLMLTGCNFFIYYLPVSPWSYSFLLMLLAFFLVIKSSTGPKLLGATLVSLSIATIGFSLYHYFINNFLLMLMMVSYFILPTSLPNKNHKKAFNRHFTIMLTVVFILSAIINVFYSVIPLRPVLEIITRLLTKSYEPLDAFYIGLAPMPVIYRIFRYINALLYVFLISHSIITIVKSGIPSKWCIINTFILLTILLIFFYIPPSYWFDRALFLWLTFGNIVITIALKIDKIGDKILAIVILIFVLTGLTYLCGYHTNDRIYKNNYFDISLISSKFIFDNLGDSKDTAISWYRYDFPGIEAAMAFADDVIQAVIYDQTTIYIEYFGKYRVEERIYVNVSSILDVQRAFDNPNLSTTNYQLVGLIFNVPYRKIYIMEKS